VAALAQVYDVSANAAPGETKEKYDSNRCSQV
jgi:hypothetical protein